MGCEMGLGFRVSIGFSALQWLRGTAACTGNIDSGSPRSGAPTTTGGTTSTGTSTGSTGGSTSGGTTTGGGDMCKAGASLAPARIWRITDQQYVNIVQQ